MNRKSGSQETTVPQEEETPDPVDMELNNPLLGRVVEMAASFQRAGFTTDDVRAMFAFWDSFKKGEIGELPPTLQNKLWDMALRAVSRSRDYPNPARPKRLFR